MEQKYLASFNSLINWLASSLTRPSSQPESARSEEIATELSIEIWSLYSFTYKNDQNERPQATGTG